MAGIKTNSGNPFIQHARQIATTGRNAPVTRPRETATTTAAPSTTKPQRARLNFIPDDSTLSRLVDHALAFIQTGRFLDRGIILNLLV